MEDVAVCDAMRGVATIARHPATTSAVFNVLSMFIVSILPNVRVGMPLV